MSGTTTSLFPDSTQLMRIQGSFPGRQFRYLPGRVNRATGTVDDYFGIIEGDPENTEDAAALQQLKNEIGQLSIKLVLGAADWEPPR